MGAMHEWALEVHEEALEAMRGVALEAVLKVEIEIARMA